MKASVVATAFVFACALAFGISAQAQDGGAPKEHGMTGCLAKGDGDMFKLTNLEKGPKEVMIAESATNLAPHVGHKIEITGIKVDGSDPKAHTMKISSIKMVSRDCP